MPVVDLEQSARLYCPVIDTPYVVQTERERGSLREMLAWAISLPAGERPMAQIELEDGRLIGGSAITALVNEYGIVTVQEGGGPLKRLTQRSSGLRAWWNNYWNN